MTGELFLYRSVAMVDLAQIRENYRIYRTHLSEKRIISVIKANAYGHGDIEVAKALAQEGADFFAVSNINEGIRLRESAITGEILILGYTPTELSHLVSKYNLSQAIVSEEHLAEALTDKNRRIKYPIAVDVGMRRIGLCPERVLTDIKNASEILKINGIFTHLPVADVPDSESVEYTQSEIDVFDAICREAERFGVELFHCQNSAAATSYSSKKSNCARMGISLYGYAPSSEVVLPSGVMPALEWKSMICRVFSVKKGESIGYGRSFFAQKDMTVATVTTGYADGYPRALSNRGYVIIKGEMCRVVGRVCMDMMMVDVSSVHDVKAGEEVVLLGHSGEKQVSADDIARWADTIPYEILTRISSRVARQYIDGK